MTLVIEKWKTVAFPRGEYGEQASSEVVFALQTNKPAPGHLVIEEAIRDGRLPASNESLGLKVPITVRGISYKDPQLFAQRYRHQNEFENDRHALKHRVTVEFESATASGSGVTANPFQDVDPLQRPIERTVEYLVDRREVVEATNVEKVGSRDAGTPGPITNTAGFPVRRKFYRPKRTPVLVLRKWVSSFEPVIALNDKFEDTLNSSKWSGIAKHKAKFLLADLGGPEYWAGAQRYQLSVKVAFSKLPWYLQVPNEGDKYFTDFKSLDVTDDDGNPITELSGFGVETVTDNDGFPLGDVPLDTDGKPRFDGKTADNLPYRDLTPADYDDLTTRVEAYS